MKFLIFFFGFLALIFISILTFFTIRSNIGKRFSRENDCDQSIVSEYVDADIVDAIDLIEIKIQSDIHFLRACYQFALQKSLDQSIDLNSIQVHQHPSNVFVVTHFQDQQILIRNPWKFSAGNYSMNLTMRVNFSEIQREARNSIAEPRIRLKHQLLFPTVCSHHCARIFNVKLTSLHEIITNFPLNQHFSPLKYDHLGLTFLHRYECRSLDKVRLCLPTSTEFFSHILMLINRTVSTLENYFNSEKPWTALTLISVSELRADFVSLPQLIFIDEQRLLRNESYEEILRQRSTLFQIVSLQWFYMFKSLNNFIRQSLSASIADHLFEQSFEPMVKQSSSIFWKISTVILDGLCLNDTFYDRTAEKLQAFFTDYRLLTNDSEFRSRIQKLTLNNNVSRWNLSMFLTILCPDLNSTIFTEISKQPRHLIIFSNSSHSQIDQYKFNNSCSSPFSIDYPILSRQINESLSVNRRWNTSSSLSIISNPWIHYGYSSLNHLLEEIQRFPSTPIDKILFDSFLLNLINKLSVKIPLELLKFFFQHASTSSAHADWLIVEKIFRWYQSMISVELKTKFQWFFRPWIVPFCTNQLWSKSMHLDWKQMINEIALEWCCSINHSICFQYLSNRHDPQGFLQSIFSFPTSNSIDFLGNASRDDRFTSRSIFLHSDRMIETLVCHVVRQQTEDYWYKLIDFIKEIFVDRHRIPSALIVGLSCAIRSQEHVDIYLSSLCLITPDRWACYRNILQYSTMKTFEQLKLIDDEYWTTNQDELLDFLFHIGQNQGFIKTTKVFLIEFRSIMASWFAANQNDFSNWLDDEPR